LEKLSGWAKTPSTEQLATEVGESVPLVLAAMEALVRRGSAVAPAPGKWLSDSRWGDAREQVLHAVREYAEKNPARYGVMKGELKAGLKSSLDAGLFDLAFAALIADRELEQTGERVRPGGMPWEPPAAAVAALEKLEGMLEADGFQVPENATWQKTLGAGATDASGLGFFLSRLVRVNAELTYTSRQMSKLQSLVAGWFDGGHASLTVADFRGITGASRKYSVPLLEHGDRVGWTVRVGDERRRG
jgi:selenocysteine-specific elongation factor